MLHAAATVAVVVTEYGWVKINSKQIRIEISF